MSRLASGDLPRSAYRCFRGVADVVGAGLLEDFFGAVDFLAALRVYREQDIAALYLAFIPLGVSAQGTAFFPAEA